MRHPSARSVVLALLAVLAAAPAARAEDWFEHSIPWYERNPRERAEALRRCQSDHRIARNPACSNAEAAQTKDWARRNRLRIQQDNRHRLFRVPAAPPPASAPRIRHADAHKAARGR
jgi:hypothetical protein